MAVLESLGALDTYWHVNTNDASQTNLGQRRELVFLFFFFLVFAGIRTYVRRLYFERKRLVYS